MAARGAFGNPWIFSRGTAAITGEPVPPLPPLKERIETAYRQIELLSTRSGERLACLQARHHVPWYLRGVAHSGYYKQQLVRVETLDELRKICDGIKKELV